MPIQGNLGSSNVSVFRNLYQTVRDIQNRLTAISSGIQINHAADNAANLQISEALSSRLRGMNQAMDNVQTGNNMLNIAEGGLSTIQDDLQRVRELTVKASNSTYTSQQRQALQSEINLRIESINKTAGAAQFNGTPLLGKDTPPSVTIQAGANGSPALDTVDITQALGDASASALGVSSVNVSTASAARASLSEIDDALASVSERRARIGAYQSQFEVAADHLSTSVVNVSSSLSQIRDANLALEILKLSQSKILAQAQISLIAQSNRINDSLYKIFDDS